MQPQWADQNDVGRWHGREVFEAVRQDRPQTSGHRTARSRFSARRGRCWLRWNMGGGGKSGSVCCQEYVREGTQPPTPRFSSLQTSLHQGRLFSSPCSKGGPRGIQQRCFVAMSLLSCMARGKRVEALSRYHFTACVDSAGCPFPNPCWGMMGWPNTYSGTATDH